MTLVESAIAVPILLIVLFGIFDMSRVFYSHMAIQHSVREGARFAVTGRRLPDPGNPGSDMTRRDSIVQKVIEQAEPFVTLQTSEVSLSAGGTQDYAGGPGQLVEVRVIHAISLLTPFSIFFQNGQVVVNVASVFKNEPFPSSFAQ